MVQMRAKMPWRSAFSTRSVLLRAGIGGISPDMVTGPLDLAPLAREAAIWAGVRGLGEFWVRLAWFVFSIAP